MSDSNTSKEAKMAYSTAYGTKEQILAIAKKKFGENVELICDCPVFIGEVSMASLGLTCDMVVFQHVNVFNNDHFLGKKYAVIVPHRRETIKVNFVTALGRRFLAIFAKRNPATLLSSSR